MLGKQASASRAQIQHLATHPTFTALRETTTECHCLAKAVALAYLERCSAVQEDLQDQQAYDGS